MNAGHKWQTVTFLAASAVMAISLAAAASFEDEAWQQTARANTTVQAERKQDGVIVPAYTAPLVGRHNKQPA